MKDKEYSMTDKQLDTGYDVYKQIIILLKSLDEPFHAVSILASIAAQYIISQDKNSLLYYRDSFISILDRSIEMQNKLDKEKE